MVVGRTRSVGTSDICVGGRRAYGVSNPASVAGVRGQGGGMPHAEVSGIAASIAVGHVHSDEGRRAFNDDGAVPLADV